MPKPSAAHLEGKMSEELKPCPFCGKAQPARTVPIQRSQYECTTCGAEGPYGVNHHDVATKWNRRQEAKPLTESELTRIIGNATGWEPLSEEVLLRTVKAIHAALPPDQSARIKELDEQLAQVLKSHTEEQDAALKAEAERNEMAAYIKNDLREYVQEVRDDHFQKYGNGYKNDRLKYYDDELAKIDAIKADQS